MMWFKKRELKLCVDCRFIVSPPYTGGDLTENSRCGRPNTGSLVTGNTESFASVEREFFHLCGRNARHFKPKESK